MPLMILLIILFPVSVFAQAQVPSDTSFTNYSAAKKVYKKFPLARLAYVKVPEDVSFLENITYVSYGKRELKLDILSPEKKPEGLLPAVIFVHGGGWRSGDRRQETALAAMLAQAGYITVLADYRMSVEALYPAAVFDLKAAVRWVRANAEKYNIDSTKIAILGTSAGGQLASFIGTTGKEGKFEGSSGSIGHSSRVEAIVNIDGLLDFTNTESTKFDGDSKKPSAASQWFGAAYKERSDLWKDASPITYVDKDTPPIVFINSALEHYHAGRDDMIAKLKELNIYYEVHTIPDSPHPFWLFHPWIEKTNEYVLGFLNKVFKK